MKLSDIVGNIEEIYEYLGEPYLASKLGKFHLFVIGLSFFIAVAFGLLLIVKKIFNRQKTHWELVEEQLNILYQKFSQDTIDAREVYFHLTEVVKCLVESRFKLKVLSKTDSEFLQALTDPSVDPALAKNLNELFERAQMAKFASFNQVKDNALQDVLLIKAAVKEWNELTRKRK